MQKIGEILVSKGYVTQQQLDGVMAVKGDDAHPFYKWLVTQSAGTPK